KTAFRKYNHAIILARFYASTDEEDKLNKLLKLNLPEKRYKLHVNLSMYLFNLKMFDKSLKHAEAAYSIKPHSADVLIALIRLNNTIVNITGLYKALQETKSQFPSREFPGEFALAEQEYKLMKNEWKPMPLSQDLDYEANDKPVLFVLNKGLP